MALHHHRFSLDHAELLASLSARANLLIIQDLDGVCMGLVRDPLTRELERRYVEAVKGLDGQFFVLTNGEHIGARGVNGLVERALGTADEARRRAMYLPGLGGGGVQLQDASGQVSHPGVSEAQMSFLREVPALGRAFLSAYLDQESLGLDRGQRASLIDACVLDNRVSPTLNLNGFHHQLRARPERYAELQRRTVGFMDSLLERAAARGLGASFFIHYAPNLGRVDGREKPRISDGSDAGTTDFQFMLRGAIKEVGVLVLLNHHYYRQTGHYPLGEGFNARDAPADIDALLELATARFEPDVMPTIVGVGDTLSSGVEDGERHRGGSDRGFLTLVQALGGRFGTDNACVFVDSSRGEIARPGVDIAKLESDPWTAMAGITDERDELALNFVFPGGHREYVDFFCQLAASRPTEA